MIGIVHLRIVTIVFVLGGILSALPYTLSLFLNDPPPPLIGWIGGVACIASAAWFSRGSNIARYFLIVLSILGLLVYGIMIFVVREGTWLDTAIMGLFGILSGYCLWALVFSKGLRAELFRRRRPT
jgi:hypothetical protein